MMYCCNALTLFSNFAYCQDLFDLLDIIFLNVCVLKRQFNFIDCYFNCFITPTVVDVYKDWPGSSALNLYI